MRWARGVACAVATSLALVVGAPLVHAGKEYTVRIATTPEGASVRIDDPDSEAVGETPWDGTLEAGPYMVIISLPGHRQLIEEITVGKQKKRQSFSFTLEAIPESTIEVASAANDDSADGATIMLDGVEAGTVPATFEATEGPHQIEVIKEGFQRWEKWVEVNGGEKTSVEVLLLLPAGEAGAGPAKVSTPRGPRVAPLVVATAGIEVGWRRWDYLEPRTGTARPFDANVVPLMRADIAAYPLAGSRTAALRTFGVRLGLGLGFPPAADAGGGQSITSSWSELELGAVYRHETDSGAWLRGDLAYSMLVFSFDETSAFAGEVPSVDYRTVRLGATVGYGGPAGGASINASYLPVLSAGTVADRFREASASGGGTGVNAWYGVTKDLTIDGSLSYRRFAHAFASQTGDAVEADGGVDIYFGAFVGASYRY